MELVEFLRARHEDEARRARYRLDDHTQWGASELDPEWVLRVVEAHRRILDRVLSERHKVVEDCWYTCPAATEEREGETTCNDLAGDECNCGRDWRVDQMLRLLALPYADHPDYDPAWAPWTAACS